MKNKVLKRTVSVFTTLAVMATMLGLGTAASAAESSSISYNFTGTNAADAGYAEGIITLTSNTAGTYELYWADDEKALDGYYSIASLELNAGDSKSVKMDYHTAIPANATKIIATRDSKTVASADAVYSVPRSKQLSFVSGDLLYSFNSYSDVHIDKNGYYKKANERLAAAFEFGVEKNTNFIVTSGDMVTNASGPDDEWTIYETILSESGYVNPVWETNGNHDMRCGVSSGLSSFIRASGTDSTKENFDKNKPYYYMIEENTGDLFIFMALESESNPSKYDEFTDEQINWVTNLLETYYDTGINIYLIEHSPISGFGAGDRMSNPYYKAMLSEDFSSTVKFKNLLKKYKNIIFISGHTHEDFAMGYNYSNENSSACHMIHNPSVAGSTMPKSDDSALDYNDGVGYNSQGYYVEAYHGRIIFYGANLTDKLIYPQYCYIMDSPRIYSVPSVAPNDSNLIGNTVSAVDKLHEAHEVLSVYYKYSSYDQYQALKKAYYQYRGEDELDQSIIDKIDQRISDLKDIAEHTGMPKVYPIGKKYYFENTKSWSKVNAYAWTGKTHNEAWPGKPIQSVSTLNGKDIYCIEFDYAGQYNNLIFNDGSNQTVDISLAEYPYNAFRISGTDSDKKYKVANFDLENGNVSNNDTYALLYYVEGEHDWSNTNTLFTSKEDGSYTCSYTAKKDCNFSCSVYDKTNGIYKCLTDSQGFDYETGKTYRFTLTSRSERGKSITVRSLTKGDILSISYNPTTEDITVTCGEPEVNTDTTTDSSTTSDTETATDSSTASDTETATDSSTASDTETATDSSTASDTETATDSSTASDTETETDSSTASDTETATDSSTTSDTDTNTDSGTASDTDTNTDSSTTSDTETETDSSTTSDTETETDSSTTSDTEMETDSSTTSDTDTATEKDTETDSETDGDTESDIETDTDTDSDTDSTTDTESELDTDTTTDTETEFDTDTTTDTETEYETDTTTDTDTAIDTETESDTDNTTDTETESDSDTATDTETESETDTTTDTETESDSDTATDTETESDTDNTTDTETESDTDTATDTESDTDSEDNPDTPDEPDLYGDINGDGKVTAKDSLLVQRHAIKLAALTDEQIKAADVDKDGKITAKDALYILRCSINLAVLPIEK